MTMRIGTSCFVWVFLFCAYIARAETGKPNIVVIMADDMGWGDSGTYGHELIQTPHMDRLAAEGVKLMQCYAAAGVCSPSRSAILTGRTPYRNGVWRHLSAFGETYLRATEITYPQLLREIGYETCHVGKWHLLSKTQFNQPEYPQPSGDIFDYAFYTQNNAAPSHKNPDNFFRNGEAVGMLEGYSAPLVADEAIHWLEDVRNPEKPFVLSVWFHEPHKPIATDKRFSELYDGHKYSKYMGNITQMDYALGKILDTLDRIGASENTFVYFTSDNGPVVSEGGSSGGLRGFKRSDFEGGIRVPGIVRWPAEVAAGTVSDVPVVGTDVFATVLAMVGLPLPNDRTIDGVNMLPALKGEALERPVPLFWRTHVSPAEERVAVRVGDWKVVANDLLTEFQLFNVQVDEREENNLAAEMPEKLEEMKRTLLSVWADIEAEGPKEWWENETQRPVKGAKLRY